MIHYSKKIAHVTTVLSSLFLASNLLFPLIATADSSATLGQHLDRGDFSIDATPASFSFTPVDISSPSTVYKTYFSSITPEYRLKVHDGRYAGGIRVTVQATPYDPGTPGDPSDDIAAANLAVLTSNNALNEVLKAETPAMATPLSGTPGDDTDYTPFTTPLVILDGAGSTPSCNIGRVGTYTTYPSFRLTIPNAATEGTYTSTITYDLMEAPLGC